jgi:hypothetical protein
MENGQFHFNYPDGRTALFFDPSATLSDVLKFVDLYNQGKDDDKKIVEVVSKEGTRKIASVG